MTEANDIALLREFAGHNSESAFAELVRRHINLVYSVALRHVGNSHQAEEIAQAVFIILAKKANALTSEGWPDRWLRRPRRQGNEGSQEEGARRGGAATSLSSWLFQATRLTAHNLVRSEIRRRRREQEAHMQTILNESGRDIWPRIAPWLDVAVAALGEKDRRAIVLRFYEGRNLREVGAALGASEDAAEKRVARALEKLRKFFSKRGVSSTTVTLADTISANSRCVAPVGLAKTVSAVALTKGAAAGGSTLTLVKGALKIMAWSKAKTAVVASAVVLLAAASTTVIGIKMTRAHHVLEKPSAALSPIMIRVTADVEADGSLHAQAAVVETNGTHQVIRTDRIDGEGGNITRITDESGRPMKFEKKVERKGRFGYVITLDRPVPPGGQIAYDFEENLTAKRSEAFGVLKTTAPDICEWRITSYPSHVHDLREIWVLHLPHGATLLAKERGMTASTNAGQVELRLDKIIPPNGGYTVGFRYRLPANAQ